MKVIKGSDLESMGRAMEFTPGGFFSHRFLLEEDGLGYTVTRTTIPECQPQRWHYPDHLESCYCVSGVGELVDLKTGEKHRIEPDTLYALDKHDEHTFQAIGGPVTLICMFTPALRGNEAHKDGHDYRSDLSPVYAVRSVPIEKVTANDYNPNSVAPPEMELLETSIWEDGYTQPVVTVYDEENDKYIVVDGFHRYLTLRNSERIRERERGMLPVVVLRKDMSDRMASTIRHNRARGSHNIELMSQIVAELVEMGKGDRWICQHIGMSPDELLRMKQVTGLASLFANREFSEAWEPESDE
ncbi:ectoine synthase/ParB multidomain protein [Mycobacterium phage Gaia]|uniref:L-ectoine synthase n=1 Tax=Mycobacterium phage Gaia TaxID=1486472 RepID=A0A068F3J9_9CAUD|nr:ParB-like partition protein [Mycobacterium phage Gaia]AID58923.1 ectoine synthase/ParB multidomain protein [Mycobacterium phage Gaia]AYR00040.1 ParB-like nuclease domain protein [Mycobacterium phage Nebkiss]